MKIGLCKLCKQEKELCNISHIIPNHAYNILKEDDLFFLIDKKNANKPSKQKRYTGEFESSILCKDCEMLISNYETYGYRLIYRLDTLNIENSITENENGLKALVIKGKGYDYSKFKLYLLSILWKASISTRPLFSEINLGKKTEEDLRNMILAGNPGEVNEYPCGIILPAIFKKEGVECFPAENILFSGSPYKVEIDGSDIFIFLITGCTYMFPINYSGDKEHFSSVQKMQLIMPFLTEEKTTEERNKVINQIRSWFID